jgi:HSF-type DNA-binding
MDGATTLASLTLSQYNFPRTGKRGVPQQFPRRLYEMLEAEAFQLDASLEHPRIISWSDSGKAFRIYDVSEFSATILPKYFRTKKFSSFQRNLNLVSIPGIDYKRIGWQDNTTCIPD